MKTDCPRCGLHFDTSATKKHENDELLAALVPFRFHVDLAIEYLNCFRVKPDSPVAHKKALRILSELVNVWEGELFWYRGRDWRTTRDQVKEAMELCCNRQLFGLKNHNYLKAILHKQAVDAEIKAEQDKHDKATKRNRTPSQGMSTAAKVIDLGEEVDYAERKRMAAEAKERLAAMTRRR